MVNSWFKLVYLPFCSQIGGKSCLGRSGGVVGFALLPQRLRACVKRGWGCVHVNQWVYDWYMYIIST